MARPDEDRLLKNSRREALVVLAAFVVCLAYTVTYCKLYGYGRPIEELTFVWGFPDWVFWGIVVPWTASLVFSIWFAFGYMQDEHLGDDVDEGLFE